MDLPTAKGLLELSLEGLWHRIVLTLRRFGAKVQALVFVVFAVLEKVLLGSVQITPLIGMLVCGITLQRGLEHEEHAKKVLAAESHNRVALQYLRSLPCTPLESADWVNAFMAEFFPWFLAPLIASRVVPRLMATIEARAPASAKFEILEWDLGTAPPVIKSMRAFHSPQGQLKHIDAEVELATENLDIQAQLRLPAVGTVQLKIDKAMVKGAMRVTPRMEERLLFIAFKEPPELDYRVVLRTNVARLQAGQGQLDFVRRILRDIIDQEFTEPNRKCLGLEVRGLGRGVVGGTVQIQVLEATGITLPRSCSALYCQVSVFEPGAGTIVRTTKVVQGTDADDSDGGGYHFSWREAEPFEMGFHGGARKFTVTLLAATSSAAGPAAGEASRTVIGRSTFTVQYLGDGSAAFHALGLDSEQLCKRWSPGHQPYEMRLPVGRSRRGSPTSRSRSGRFGTTAARLGGDASITEEMQASQSLPLADIIGTKDFAGSLSPESPRFRSNGVRSGGLPTLNRSTTDVPREKKPGFLKRLRSRMSKAHNSKSGASQSSPDRPGAPAAASPSWGQYEGVQAPESPEGPYKDFATGGWLTVGLAMKEWQHKRGVPQPASTGPPRYRSPGPHTLIIQLLEGKDLVARDANGMSDPYVKFSHSGKDFKTKFVKRSLAPVWLETFKVKEDKQPHRRRVRLHVWDHDSHSRDDPMGVAILNLDGVAEKEVHDEWLELYGVESGQVRVRCVVVPGLPESSEVAAVWEQWHGNYMQDATFAAAGAAEADAEGDETCLNVHSSRSGVAEVTPEVISVQVIRARNLVAMDRNGFSDPYVKLYYGTEARVKSRTIKKTLNPEWNLSVAYRYQQAADLRLVLKDQDPHVMGLSKDDPLGHLVLTSAELRKRRFLISEWLPLEDVAHGEVFVELKPVAMQHLPRGALDAMTQAAGAAVLEGGCPQDGRSDRPASTIQEMLQAKGLTGELLGRRWRTTTE